MPLGIMTKISLTKDEVDYLIDYVKKGRKSAREMTRVRILLLLHDGKKEMEIKELLGISRATVSNVKKRYRDEGLQKSLKERPRTGQPKKYNLKHEAEIIATACTKPPKGRRRWTVRLLTERMSARKGFESINRETVRLILKKPKQSLG
jgi:transposase